MKPFLLWLFRRVQWVAGFIFDETLFGEAVFIFAVMMLVNMIVRLALHVK
ncbi:hypothetical protein [Moorella sp. ACPs]|jgi:hypothetical protein